MTRSISVLAAVAAAAALAACNSSSNPNPNPTLGPTCVLPSGTQTALVYPAPGSTLVNDSNGQIVIGSTTALPSNWQIVITDAVFPNGLALSPLQSASPPFPNPNQTPSFANPQYQTASTGAPFASSQVVTVYVNNTSSNCSPLQIGTFST